MHKQLLKREGGFTLLELLIVIVIIGILAVLIIPNLVSGPQRARDSQRKSDLRNIKTALETYYNDNNTYPVTGGACQPDVGACLGTVFQAGSTPYMKTVPKDPKGTVQYAYNPTCTSSPVVCTSYTLTATLENTKDSDASAGVYTVTSAN
jgi:general secretion pathway protein G